MAEIDKLYNSVSQKITDNTIMVMTLFIMMILRNQLMNIIQLVANMMNKVIEWF